MSITLSKDQQAALNACILQLTICGEAVLVGAAGTGKTTVMKSILGLWEGNAMFFAPTGKAAVRLAASVGAANTLHSAFFGCVSEEIDSDEDEDDDKKKKKPPGREKLNFSEPHPPEGAGSSTLIVVDEASMVNEELARTVREQCQRVGASILWVGDHHQLPPVEGQWGADLQNPTGALEKVHRQALDSAVLDLATCIREDRAGDFTRWDAQGDVSQHPCRLESACAWSERNPDRQLLTFTNRVRISANRIIRESRGLPTDCVVSGEKMLCTFNNRNVGLMNGQQFEVADVKDCPELSRFLKTRVQWVRPVGWGDEDSGFDSGHWLLVVPSAFEQGPKDRSARDAFRKAFKPLFDRKMAWERQLDLGWNRDDLRLWRDRVSKLSLQCTYGYCLTVHKSQGSQWGEIGFISCPTYRSMHMRRYDFWRRMTYTAITRAEKACRIFKIG